MRINRLLQANAFGSNITQRAIIPRSLRRLPPLKILAGQIQMMEGDIFQQQKATKITQEIISNPKQFFTNNLSDAFVKNFTEQNPVFKELTLAAGEEPGRLYPEIYSHLTYHNQGILPLAKTYSEIIGLNLSPYEDNLLTAMVNAHDVGKTFGSAQIWNQKGKPEGLLEYLINNHAAMGSFVTKSLGEQAEINVFTAGHHSIAGEMQKNLVKERISEITKEEQLPRAMKMKVFETGSPFSIYIKRMSAIFEIAKGADIRQALRAEKDELRMYRQQPLDWFKTHFLINQELKNRKRLTEDVYHAIVENDFGKNPAKQKIYAMLKEDEAKGNLSVKDTREFLVNNLCIEQAKDANTESILEICTNILHKIIT